MGSANEHVCVQGDPNQVDSLVACLVAVLNAWDHPVSYDWVAGLAGIAFSPVQNPGEDCTAWWMEAGSDSRIDQLGRVLGFTAERVTREAVWDDAAREAYATTGMLPVLHEDHFARLRAAFDRGDAVVLRTWPAWSLLVGWTRDLDQLPFATVPGFEDLVSGIWGPAQAQLAYLLNPMPGDITVEEAVGDALRYGARVACGLGQDSSLKYGAALYAAAAERMKSDVFCPECQDHSDSCVHRTLMRMLGTQRSAVGFLHDAQVLMGGDLPWNPAIDRFVTMAEVTSVYCSWPDFHENWPNATYRGNLSNDLRTLAALQTEAAGVLAELSGAFEGQTAV
jgi:hypothetical protein